MAMSEHERQEFLAGVHVGVISIERADGPPLTVPIWYGYEPGGLVWIITGAETLKGKRDRAIIAVLLGCGLRRRELADLSFDHLQRREDRWAIVDLVGKGGHGRIVPVPEWVKQFLDEWLLPVRCGLG